MTTEAEKLAQELEAPVEGYIEPTLLEEKAAALLRSQAQEIERLNFKVAALEGALGNEERKDALLRSLYNNSTFADWPEDLNDRIKKELGLCH